MLYSGKFISFSLSPGTEDLVLRAYCGILGRLCSVKLLSLKGRIFSGHMSITLAMFTRRFTTTWVRQQLHVSFDKLLF
jgi:hypothetical protein